MTDVKKFTIIYLILGQAFVASVGLLVNIEEEATLLIIHVVDHTKAESCASWHM